MRVVFGLNITDSINLALYGLLQPGDHVITSSMEHNAVMRPLRVLEKMGVNLSVAPCELDGSLDPQKVEQAILPNTKLVVINQASNVCGAILPVRQVGKIVRQHNLLLLVDAAQSAGVLPIDMQADLIDFLAFTGHKSLYGPMGTGGLVLGERVDIQKLQPIRQGGTGSRSELEIQPEFLPDRYECGTPNAVGLAGLCAALEWMDATGLNKIRMHEKQLCQALIDGLREIPGVILYGPKDAELQTATIGFNIQGVQPSTVGMRLEDEYKILCRVGLHCAPAAHRTIGTFPTGCVRFGLGAFITHEQVQQAIQAVRELAMETE
jgi:cysteine desulfurase family protein